MQYAVLLRRRTDGSYQVSVPLLPDLTRIAATRDEALQLARSALVEAMTTTEVVYLDVPEELTGAVNPWMETFGMFHDDPTLESLLTDIYAQRDAE